MSRKGRKLPPARGRAAMDFTPQAFPWLATPDLPPGGASRPDQDAEASWPTGQADRDATVHHRDDHGLHRSATPPCPSQLPRGLSL